MLIKNDELKKGEVKFEEYRLIVLGDACSYSQCDLTCYGDEMKPVKEGNLNIKK